MNLDARCLGPFGSTFVLTRHGRDRLASRGIRPEALCAALLYGRVVFVRGAEICVIGRKEVARYRREGIDLSRHEGVQVVCSPEGAILTAYRNRHLSLHPHGLAPGRRRRRPGRGAAGARGAGEREAGPGREAGRPGPGARRARGGAEPPRARDRARGEGRRGAG